jgi:hypothetical protein
MGIGALLDLSVSEPTALWAVFLGQSPSGLLHRSSSSSFPFVQEPASFRDKTGVIEVTDQTHQ